MASGIVNNRIQAHAFSNKSADAISLKCPEINSLHLTGCKLITNSGIRRLVSRCHKIVTLGLGSTGVSGNLLSSSDSVFIYSRI